MPNYPTTSWTTTTWTTTTPPPVWPRPSASPATPTMLPIDAPQQPVHGEIRFFTDGTRMRFVQDQRSAPGIGVWISISNDTIVRRTTSTPVTTTTVVPGVTTRSAASHTETSYGAVRHRNFIPLPRVDDDDPKAQQ